MASFSNIGFAQFLICFILLFIAVFVSGERKRSDHLALSPENSAILKQFKQEMDPLLNQDFMKKDIFLVRFLRAKNFNLEEAKKMLTASIAWRKANSMDTIHTENWDDMSANYPIYLEGVDKLGQSVFHVNFGEEWNIEEAAQANKMDRLNRWIMKGIDAAMMKVWTNGTLSKTATRFSFIYNSKSFDLKKHACFGDVMQASCMKVYVDFTNAYELNYPEMCDNLFLINVPTSYDIVLTLIRPLFSKATNEMLKIMGEDPKTWEPVIYAEVDRDQLPEEIGGTRPRHVKSGNVPIKGRQ